MRCAVMRSWRLRSAAQTGHLLSPLPKKCTKAKGHSPYFAFFSGFSIEHLPVRSSPESTQRLLSGLKVDRRLFGPRSPRKVDFEPTRRLRVNLVPRVASKMTFLTRKTYSESTSWARKSTLSRLKAVQPSFAVPASLCQASQEPL